MLALKSIFHCVCTPALKNACLHQASRLQNGDASVKMYVCASIRNDTVVHRCMCHLHCRW